MEIEKKEELRTALRRFLTAELERIIFSNPRSREHFLKLTVRPLLLRGTLYFQIEEFTEKQAFQKNLDGEAALEYLMSQLETLYRNGEAVSVSGVLTILIGKKGTVTLKEKKTAPRITASVPALQSHNRTKRYVLPEGIPVPFLVDLGVMTAEGRVVKAKYDKSARLTVFWNLLRIFCPACPGREPILSLISAVENPTSPLQCIII